MISIQVTEEHAALAEKVLSESINGKLKAEANKLFASRNYDEAIKKYTDAVSFNPNVPSYYTNRAFAYIKQELYGAAIRDAETAISLDPKFIKAYYRRATGNMALGKLKGKNLRFKFPADAIKDLRQVVKYAPTDSDAKKKLSECEKEQRRIDFENAIAVEDPRSVVEQFGDIDLIEVDQSYDGPVFETSGITVEFVKHMMEWMKAEKKLHKKFALQILFAVRKYFFAQPAIVDVTIPKGAKLTVCGDIHGQFYDLLFIFEKNGLPSPTNIYLFNGDFVDRGSFSIECILTLFAWKLLYPTGMYLSRGNHETDDMNRVYGFRNECISKYSELTFKLFSEIFNAIPIGNLVQEKILVIHGGLFSRDDVTMDEIRAIDRFRQPGSEGLMCELLWSDPQPEKGRSPSKRGVGIQFGPDVTKNFLEKNNLKCIIRSHEVKQEGYSIDHDGKCITIFSAPNYCDSVGNKGAYIHITPDLKMEYHKFEAAPRLSSVKAMAYASQMGGFF